MQLTATEARVLGTLLEKQALTPDYYPMTLKALATACSQKTSREPVMELGEAETLGAVRGLMAKGLAHERDTAEGRVLKYSHNLAGLGGFNSQEQAVLTVLLLRGEQTSGELRGRTERMAAFEGPAQVERVLQALAERPDQPLALRLPRRPGEKESRWCHLLCGQPAEPAPQAETPSPSPLESRVESLEAEVESLKRLVSTLRAELDVLKGQGGGPTALA